MDMGIYKARENVIGIGCISLRQDRFNFTVMDSDAAGKIFLFTMSTIFPEMANGILALPFLTSTIKGFLKSNQNFKKI